MSRKTVREALVTLLDADSAFNEVLGYLPTDLFGKSKVLAVYAATSRYDLISRNIANDFYTFNIDSIVRRDNTAASEGDLDAMRAALIAVLSANIQTANWSHLDLTEDSDCFFAEISGVPHRIEQHKVKIKVTN